MNFFEDPKNAGLAFIGAALLAVLGAIVVIATGATAEGTSGTFKVGIAITGIGSILGALVYFKFGKALRAGDYSGKMTILGNVVKTAGVAQIIVGIFALVGGILAQGASAGVIGILIGLVFIWVANKMMDGKATTIDKIVWILLLVFSVLGILASLGLIISIVGILNGLCALVINLMVLLYTLDPEVKKQMGM